MAVLWFALLAPLAALALVVGMPRLQRWAEAEVHAVRERPRHGDLGD